MARLTSYRKLSTILNCLVCWFRGHDARYIAFEGIGRIWVCRRCGKVVSTELSLPSSHKCLKEK